MAAWFGAVAGLVGSLVTIGWLVGIPELTTLGTGEVSMKLNTSLCILVLSSAAVLRHRRLTRLASAFVFVVAGAAVVEYAFAIDVGVNELVVRDAPAGPSLPGGMALTVAICLLALGAVALAGPRSNPRWVQAGAGAVVAVSFVALLGHAYGARTLYEVVPRSTIAIPTAIALAALALSALADVDRGLLPWLARGHDAGAVLLRRMLPLPLLVLPALGYARLVGQELGWYGTAFGAALLTGFSMVAVLLVSAVGARHVARFDEQRLTALHQLTELNTMLTGQVHAHSEDLDRARTVTSLLEDRGRLVADHNDRVLQRIFAAGMQITGAVRREPDSTFAERSPDVLTQLNEAIAELRGTIHVLNRPADTPPDDQPDPRHPPPASDCPGWRGASTLGATYGGDVVVNKSYPYDPDLHEKGSVAAQGICSQHGGDSPDRESCAGEPVVSFQDRHGRWQSGCSVALKQLVERGEIEPLGQGA